MIRTRGFTRLFLGQMLSPAGLFGPEAGIVFLAVGTLTGCRGRAGKFPPDKKESYTRQPGQAPLKTGAGLP